MGARGPKPGFKKQRAAVLEAAAQASPPEIEPAAPASTDAFQKHRRVEDMQEPELRNYAVQIGLSRRDAVGLSVPRLRQNCVLMLHQRIEELT